MIEDLWYKNAVIYSLDLETFMDFNGDGIGDFEGLTRKLDYLAALNIDTIWLAPFQTSPNKDNGYDISDFYTVDKRHGTGGDFVEFMHQAEKRGIKVIIDLVVNHTSDQHPWFQESRSGEDSGRRDWYVWSKTKPKNWNKGMVFPGVQKATWTYDEKAKAYYHHRFYDHQPDLNIDNYEVRAEIRRIIGFWLQMGVAGFRVDAVPFIIEEQEPGNENPTLRFEYLREIKRFLEWRKGDAILLGEANVVPEDANKYFGEEGSGIHLMFNFWVNQFLFYSLATGDVEPLAKAINETKIEFYGSQWAQFLRNHDELDLGRLSEEQRSQVFERFGKEKVMQLYDRGLRRRLASMLGSRQQIELAYSLMFSLPGTPVIRYGDEIGMGEDLTLKERDAVRTPMQWSSGEQAGFSTAKKLVHPVISEGAFSYKYVNVDDQKRDPESLLNWMTAIIRLRRECPEIGWGSYRIIKTSQPAVLCMQYEWQQTQLLTLHNFSTQPCEVMVNAEEVSEVKLVDLIKTNDCIMDEKGRFVITLEAHGYRWYRPGNMSPALVRTR